MPPKRSRRMVQPEGGAPTLDRMMQFLLPQAAAAQEPTMVPAASGSFKVKEDKKVEPGPSVGGLAKELSKAATVIVEGKPKKIDPKKVEPKHEQAAEAAISNIKADTDAGADPAAKTITQHIQEGGAEAPQDKESSDITKALVYGAVGAGATAIGGALGGAEGAAIGAGQAQQAIERIDEAEKEAAKGEAQAERAAEELKLKERKLGLEERKVRAQEALVGVKAEEKKKGKPLSSKDVQSINEGNVIPNTLKDIEKTIEGFEELFGPIEGRVRSANPYDTRGQTVNAEMRAASQQFGRYMEGGVLRKEDEEKYRKMFPQLSDTPLVAKGKLDVVRKLLVNKQKSNLDALKAQGFDVTGLDAGLPAATPQKPVDSMSRDERLQLFDMLNK